MELIHYFMMILLILTISGNRVKTYQWTKKKLLLTALAAYMIITVVTFSIL